jgi:hypothetical protein
MENDNGGGSANEVPLDLWGNDHNEKGDPPGRPYKCRGRGRPRLWDYRTTTTFFTA